MSALIGCAVICAVLFAIFSLILSPTAGLIAAAVWAVVSVLGWIGSRTA